MRFWGALFVCKGTRLSGWELCGFHWPGEGRLGLGRSATRSQDQKSGAGLGEKGAPFTFHSPPLQMVGRAGRKGQSDVGESFIIGQGLPSFSSQIYFQGRQ